MAVDAPAVLPPQQASKEIVQSASTGSAYQLTFQDFTLHVVDDTLLDQESAAQAIAEAQDLSAAVRALGNAAYLKGYPSAKLSYARDGQNVFILVKSEPVVSLTAPDLIAPYFERMDMGDIRDTDLEPRRVLANLQSERAGKNYSASAENGELAFRERDSEGDQTDFYIEFGNPGNRFVGRHFLDGMARFSTQSGAEFKGFARTALSGLNDDAQSEDFDEFVLSASQVTPHGVIALALHRVTYDQVVLNTPLDAELLEGEFTWLYPVFASFSSRLATLFKVEHTHKETEIRAGGQLVQEEPYTSVELGLGYSKAWLPRSYKIELETNLAVKQGLGDDSEPLTVSDLGYLLVRPLVRGRFLTDGHSFSMDLLGQWSEDPVPEQQQWVLGGDGSLYASLPGLAVGDSGAVARLQYEPPSLELGWMDVGLKAFTEYGVTRFESSVGGIRDTGSKSQTDVGGEVEFNFPWGLEAAIGSAVEVDTSGLSRAEERAADANYYFRVRMSF